jgi:hypothetical protein
MIKRAATILSNFMQHFSHRHRLPDTNTKIHSKISSMTFNKKRIKKTAIRRGGEMAV